jgi:hypothetical protein
MTWTSIDEAPRPAARPHAPPNEPSARARRGLAARIVAWARGPTLARDIAAVLTLKLVLLVALKYAFFNHPQAEHMSMPPAAVAQALLSVPATRPSQGADHAQ